MLLDEATSALDAENEREVQASLDKLMIGRTIITVAHRIETIKNSDVIYVFEKGAIVEEGTYQELKMMQGVFSQLEEGEKSDGSICKIS
jgi:ABC-type multidrug transport system fused ATPase/permease subunit